MMYSASVVLSATIDCSFDDQGIGQPVKSITKPVLDLAVPGSTLAVLLFQLPQKSVSTKSVMHCFFFGFKTRPFCHIQLWYS